MGSKKVNLGQNKVINYICTNFYQIYHKVRFCIYPQFTAHTFLITILLVHLPLYIYRSYPIILSEKIVLTVILSDIFRFRLCYRINFLSCSPMDEIDHSSWIISNYYFLNSRSEKMDKWMTKQPNSQFSHSRIIRITRCYSSLSLPKIWHAWKTSLNGQSGK